jgi:hypothetical protein
MKKPRQLFAFDFLLYAARQTVLEVLELCLLGERGVVHHLNEMRRRGVATSQLLCSEL